MSRSLGLAVLLSLAWTGAAAAADPVAYRCDDGSRVTAIFLETDPPVAIVTDAGHLYALPLRVSASGARYAASEDFDGTTFWVKGDEARFERPRAAARTCRVVQG